jgi:glycosyltransferase involved in cell wall biosynthesis
MDMQDLQKAKKTRVLLVTEFSGLNTGFSVMAHDLLTKLHASGKYEVAELASYVEDNDPRIRSVPWKVYPVVPSNPEERKVYNENYRTAQFGHYRFDRAVLEFKPDIVFSYRDFWHDEWITKMPSRYLFNYVWSACVDSEPPRAEWIGTYSSVDKVTSYSDWGLSVVKNYSGNKISIARNNAMPGVDLNIFKPTSKAEARKLLGLKEDIKLVLTVMRNQPRKLFPDLMKAFKDALGIWDDKGLKNLVDNTYLYLHTSYPDVGFDIGKDIIKYKLASKVIMTYCCNHCGYYFASFFAGEVCYCHSCNNYTAHPPNTALGLTREQLATVYNSADLYCQLSIAGALEIPLIEAKACGVPTIATDYAAMYELNRMGGSYGGIEVAAWREESDKETGQVRAMPSVKDCSDKISAFFMEPENVRSDLAKEARKSAELNHTTTQTFNKWDAIFSELPSLNPNRWFAPANKININEDAVNSIEQDEDFISYLVKAYAPPKTSYASYVAEKELLMNLRSKVRQDGNQSRRFSRKDILDIFKTLVNGFNIFEEQRYKYCNNIFEINNDPSEVL